MKQSVPSCRFIGHIEINYSMFKYVLIGGICIREDVECQTQKVVAGAFQRRLIDERHKQIGKIEGRWKKESRGW